MKYLLFVHQDGAAGPGTGAELDEAGDPRAEAAEYIALKADLIDRGVWLGGQALHDRTMATRIEVRRGETLIVDGPLVESSEQIIGYYLLDCRDLEEVLAIAARIPGARRGHVEVRPVWEYEAEMEAEDSSESGGPG